MIRLLTNDASDIAAAGNVLSSTVMNAVGEAAVDISLVLPGTSTRAAQFHTVTTLPNNPDWQDGTAVVYVEVITGFANVQWAVNVVREDPTGANIEQQTLSPEQTTNAGTLTFNDFVGITWSAGAVTDRMRLRIQARTTNGTGRTVAFRVGTTSNSRLELPVVDEVQATASMQGGGVASAAAATRANLNAALVAGAAFTGPLKGRANLVASMVAGPSASAVAATRANLLASGAAGGAASGMSASRANMLAALAAGAAQSGALKGSARLEAAGPAGAAFTGTGRGTAALGGRNVAGAVGRGALGKVAQLTARAIGGANFRSFSTGNKASITGRGIGGAAFAGAVRGTASMAGAGSAGATGSATSSLITGAVGCFARIIQAVRDRYVAQIEVLEGVPTLHDNEAPEDMGDFDLWVRLAITAEPTTQLAFGEGGAQPHRYLGTAVARIFLRRGLGDGDAWDLADAINAAFRGITDDEIVYTPPPFPTVRGATGDRWEIDVTVPFYGLCAEEAVA